jgi:FkbM family methyltransferase
VGKELRTPNWKIASILRRLTRTSFEYLLRKRGYKLEEIGMPPRGFSNFLGYVKSRGLQPKTVFDIGVGQGTPWLYEGFAESNFVLIEASPAFRADVEAIAARLSADHYMVGLGRSEGQALIRIPKSRATGASFLPRSPEFATLRRRRGETIEDDYVEVSRTTLDRLANYEPPFFIKLDVEGAELDVLVGATESLKGTEMVLMEISIFPRHQTEASFSEMIDFMDDAGFALFDIVDMSQAGVGGQLIYVDAAFARKGHSLWTP